MTEEVIQIENDNITTINRKIKEERKANGRLVAVIVALFLLFLAIYHAWIRKVAVLAGVLIPALIMIFYGGWVVFLAKRDKQKRLLMARQLEDEARRELSASKNIISGTNTNNVNSSSTITTTTTAATATVDDDNIKTISHSTKSSNDIDHDPLKANNKRKHHKRRKHKNVSVASSHIAKKWKDKKPSFRQRLFRQNIQTETLFKYQKKDMPLCRTFSIP